MPVKYYIIIGLVIAAAIGAYLYVQSEIDETVEIVELTNDKTVLTKENDAQKRDAQTRMEQNEILNADITPAAFADILQSGKF